MLLPTLLITGKTTLGYSPQYKETSPRWGLWYCQCTVWVIQYCTS